MHRVGLKIATDISLSLQKFNNNQTTIMADKLRKTEAELSEIKQDYHKDNVESQTTIADLERVKAALSGELIGLEQRIMSKD